MKSNWKSEAEFQAACYRWYMREVEEEEWGRLIGIYNNPMNISQLISMGLRPGISDFLYYPEGILEVDNMVWVRPSVWIELKIEGKKQNPNQLKFEPMVKRFGHQYYLVTEDIEIFKSLILKLRSYGK
jgi:hypothetical protein